MVCTEDEWDSFRHGFDEGMAWSPSSNIEDAIKDRKHLQKEHDVPYVILKQTRKRVM